MPSFSLAAQVETFQSAVERFEKASPMIQAGLPACRVALTRLQWFAKNETGLRAFIADNPNPPKASDVKGCVAGVLGARNWLVEYAIVDVKNDGQRDYLTQRLDAAIDTICWLDDHAHHVRAWAAASKGGAA
jgi:hypothetical protein